MSQTPAHSAVSILAVDFGSVTTRATYFDVVNGSYRFIAAQEVPSTPGHTLGLQFAIQPLLQELEYVSGLQLTNADGLPLVPHQNGKGVDQFFWTTSAEAPRRVFLAGLTRQHSLPALQKVVESQPLLVVGTLVASDLASESERVEWVRSTQPDLILIAGGVDGGAQHEVKRLVDVIAMAVRLMGENPPIVIFSGNSNLHPIVQQAFPQVQLFLTDNITPSLNTFQPQPLVHQLAKATQYDLAYRNANFTQLFSHSSAAPLTTSHAFGRAVQFLGHKQGRVLAMDVGSRMVMTAFADRENFALRVHSDLGLGHSAVNTLNQVGLPAVTQWLEPATTDTTQTQNTIYNKVLSPANVPSELHDLQVEQALARAALQKALAPYAEQAIDSLVVAGAVFRHAPQDGQIIFTALDVFRGFGVFSFVLDRLAVLPMLGAIASTNPLAVVQIFASGVLETLAQVVVPRFHLGKGSTILKVTINEEGGTEQFLDVPAGQCVEWQGVGRVTLQPLGGTDIGNGANQPRTLQLAHLPKGLIIDARLK
jgi:hypothetical protein